MPSVSSTTSRRPAGSGARCRTWVARPRAPATFVAPADPRAASSPRERSTAAKSALGASSSWVPRKPESGPWKRCRPYWIGAAAPKLTTPTRASAGSSRPSSARAAASSTSSTRPGCAPVPVPAAPQPVSSSAGVPPTGSQVELEVSIANTRSMRSPRSMPAATRPATKALGGPPSCEPSAGYATDRRGPPRKGSTSAGPPRGAPAHPATASCSARSGIPGRTRVTSVGRLRRRPAGRRVQLCPASSSSTCFTSAGSSGAVRGSNFATTSPFRSTRYFWKFHCTSPPIGAGRPVSLW